MGQRDAWTEEDRRLVIMGEFRSAVHSGLVASTREMMCFSVRGAKLWEALCLSVIEALIAHPADYTTPLAMRGLIDALALGGEGERDDLAFARREWAAKARSKLWALEIRWAS